MASLRTNSWVFNLDLTQLPKVKILRKQQQQQQQQQQQKQILTVSRNQKLTVILQSVAQIILNRHGQK